MFDPEEFKKTFTALARELEEGNVKLPVKEIPNIIRSKEDKPLFQDYNPSVIDFLQRCKTDEEGREVIVFLHKKGELTTNEKNTLLKRLEQKGIRDFGPLRKAGYYDKQEKVKKHTRKISSSDNAHQHE